MNIAIIVAGGVGARAGFDAPKQFEKVRGIELIAHTLAAFNCHDKIDKIIVGCVAGYEKFLWEIAEKYGFDKIKTVATGGDTRQATVFNCLEAANGEADDIVLIHDAARPLVTREIISENIALAERSGAVTTCVPSADTLARSRAGDIIDEIPQRSEFFQVQTPQTFKFDVIYAAHINAQKKGVTNATDDCGLCLLNGASVCIAKGSKKNFKVTEKEDLDMAGWFAGELI